MGPISYLGAGVGRSAASRARKEATRRAPVQETHERSVAGHGEIADGHSDNYVDGAPEDVPVLRVLQRHVRS